MSTKTKSKTNDTEILVAAMKELGIDVSMLLDIATKKKEAKKPVDDVIGNFKDSKGNSIEVKRWADKEGSVYVAQTKVLPDGTRTKGFAIPVAEFKGYVAKLNSIADKLGA